MKTAKELVDELSADGLTQAQISQETGVTQPTISRIQSGQSDGRSSTWKSIAALHDRHFHSPPNIPVHSSAQQIKGEVSA